MKSSASIATLAPALVAALAEIGGVSKGKTNPHFKSKYATLESVIEASKGILANHGIALMQFPSAFNGGAMSLDTVLLHESGEWLSGEEAFGVATGKQDPQAVGSALTYARRYAQMAVLNMPAVDDDAEAAVRPPGQSKPQEPSAAADFAIATMRRCRDLGELTEFWTKNAKGLLAKLTPAEFAKVEKAKDDEKVRHTTTETPFDQKKAA